MKAEIKKSFLKGAAFAAGVGVFATLSFIVAQSINTFTSGEVVSASKINENFQMAAPQGAVMAFYLSACPSGWIAADGTNGTPDLRATSSAAVIQAMPRAATPTVIEPLVQLKAIYLALTITTWESPMTLHLQCQAHGMARYIEMAALAAIPGIQDLLAAQKPARKTSPLPIACERTLK